MTKEQLEEKIKNNETVWYIYYNTCDEQYDFLKLHLKGNFIIKNKSDDYTKVLIKCDDLEHMDYYICDLDNIFCTKEDAQFYLNYNNITRTEKLPFVTWKEFIEGKEIIFSTPFKEIISISYITYDGEYDNEIAILNRTKGSITKSLIASEKNFNEIYKIAKKLFYGKIY